MHLRSLPDKRGPTGPEELFKMLRYHVTKMLQRPNLMFSYP
jgi:hypothetical protein